MLLLERRRAVSVFRSESNLPRRGRQRPHSSGRLGGFSGACSSCGYMNATAAFAKKTAATIGKDGGNFRNNRQRDFFRRFAANIKSSRRVEISGSRFEIERSIF